MESEFWDVPDGKIAAVVTHLQMMERPVRPTTPRRALSVAAELVHHAKPDLDWYRDLFTRVGADWMWFSRAGSDDATLAGLVHTGAVQVYSVRVNGHDEGLLELDFSVEGECELVLFGLTSALVGTGVGGWLMDHALDIAWAHPITRLHVHTCTLDSPQALPFYTRSGFVAYRRQVEIADDPRKTGDLPRDACPQEPVI